MKKTTLAPLVLATLTFAIFFWFKRFNQPTLTEDLPQTLLVGTSSDFPPFSFRDAQNTIVGFDIDVVKEVAKRLKMKISIEDMRFDMLLPELQVGHIHAIAAGMTATPERAKAVLFTKPYLSGNPLVVVSRAQDPIKNSEELKDKEVLVNTGYFADIYLSKIPGITLTRLSTPADAFAALERGAGAAFVTATFTLEPFFAKFDKNKFHLHVLEETDENSALAISREYPDLLEKIEKVIEEMRVDGTLDALKREWKIA